MASTSVSVGENHGVPENAGSSQLIRVILADTQAIFRAGLRKIFALEDDIRVVGQAETLPQTQSAVTKFSADILIFESALGAESGGSRDRTSAPGAAIEDCCGHARFRRTTYP